MASSTAIVGLHRQRQVALRSAVARDVARVWPVLVWDDLDGSFPPFAARTSVLVREYRRVSSGVAGGYVRGLRVAAGLPGTVSVVPAGPVDAERLAVSLHVTSVAGVKAAAARGEGPAQALGAALVRTSGVVTRAVMDAGRETVMATVAADPAAAGWRRVLGGAGCAFCRMLADRDAVYSEVSADFASHDGCVCHAAPDYGDGARAVREYRRSTRNVSDADRARVRAWVRANPLAG